MPIKSYLVLLCSILFVSEGIAQAEKTTDRVVKLFEAGNTTELVEHFIPKIDLTVLNTNDIFSRDQAEQILKKFFKKHPPKAMELEHKGTSRLEDKYRIGKLITEEDAYRITFFLKKVDDELYVKQLRIEQYNDDF